MLCTNNISKTTLESRDFKIRTFNFEGAKSISMYNTKFASKLNKL